MITVGDLIEILKREDLNAPIIYQYYLAEHFEPQPSNEVFAEIAKEYNSLIIGAIFYRELSWRIENRG